MFPVFRGLLCNQVFGKHGVTTALVAMHVHDGMMVQQLQSVAMHVHHELHHLLCFYYFCKKISAYS